MLDENFFGQIYFLKISGKISLSNEEIYALY
jgi:hypothetical protein